MSSTSLPQLIGAARAEWLNGDPQAWTRYVACCLELDAELRNAQRVSTPPLSPSHEPSPEQPRTQHG
jgi:hypothetical protein